MSAIKTIGGGRLDLSGVKVVEVAPLTTPLEQSSGTEIDLREKPLTEEAFQWLLERRPGTHAFLNFFPKFMQAMVAEVLARQIALDEIKFFVGYDGDKVPCHAKILARQAEITSWRDQEFSAIDQLPTAVYDDDVKDAERAKIREEAGRRLLAINVNDFLFTPVWWVDPRINPRLLEVLRENGGNVTDAFLRGDRVDAIVRSGCFYETENGLVGFSGSPWFYDKEMAMVRVATSPIGRMCLRHPSAGNSRDTIETYHGKGQRARQARVRQWWGISRMEQSRLARIATQDGSRGKAPSRTQLSRLAIDQALREMSSPRIREAKPQTGRGCR